jgi:hypothetical protein
MLQALDFEINSYLEGHASVSVTFAGDEVHVVIHSTAQPAHNGRTIYPANLWMAWRRRFTSLHIEQWHPEYMTTNLTVRDGARWSVQYQMDDVWQTRRGVTRLPHNWLAFLRWLDVIAPIFFIGEVDNLTLGYRQGFHIEKMHITRPNRSIVLTRDLPSGEHTSFLTVRHPAVLDLLDDVSFTAADAKCMSPGVLTKTKTGYFLMATMHHQEPLAIQGLQGIASLPGNWDDFLDDLQDLLASENDFSLFTDRPDSIVGRA